MLLLLLGNWRGALLVATIIPLSMLFAAILMRVFNVSGNLMSLGALDFGLIVDGAVVMVENAVRRRAEAQHKHSHEPPERTILEACLEVARPVVFAVAIIAIVYLPILSLRGIEGKMFVPMALTVVFALVRFADSVFDLRSGDAGAHFARQSFGKRKFSDSLVKANLQACVRLCDAISFAGLGGRRRLGVDFRRDFSFSRRRIYSASR